MKSYYEKNKKRILAARRAYYLKNRAKINRKTKQKRAWNVEEYRAYQAAYKKKHRTRIRRHQRAYMKKWKLSDRGIRYRLCHGTNLRPKHIPSELVELKRAHLQLNHELMKLA